MKVSKLALTMITLFGSGAALAASPNVQGDSSGPLVATGPSDHILFNGLNSGLALNGASTYIDLADGPIRGSNAAIARGSNYLQPKDVSSTLPNLPINIAQVWKASASSGAANFAINSVRQIITLSIAPQFGGLVIGQVANASGTPLTVGSGVYFGEWAPSVGSPGSNNTKLNMDSAQRTVWYVGDNAVTNATMPTAISATYGVIGISQTGTDASGNTMAGGLPSSPNLYKGLLNVSYAGGTGTIGAGATNNSISRVVGGVTQTISFAGTNISSNGTFTNGSTISGQFYNGANELAGKYSGGTLPDAAFGGSKVSGTITP